MAPGMANFFFCMLIAYQGNHPHAAWAWGNPLKGMLAPISTLQLSFVLFFLGGFASLSLSLQRRGCEV